METMKNEEFYEEDCIYTTETDFGSIYYFRLYKYNSRKMEIILKQCDKNGKFYKKDHFKIYLFNRLNKKIKEKDNLKFYKKIKKEK